MSRHVQLEVQGRGDSSCTCCTDTESNASSALAIGCMDLGMHGAGSHSHGVLAVEQCSLMSTRTRKGADTIHLAAGLHTGCACLCSPCVNHHRLLSQHQMQTVLPHDVGGVHCFACNIYADSRQSGTRQTPDGRDRQVQIDRCNQQVASNVSDNV